MFNPKVQINTYVSIELWYNLNFGSAAILQICNI